MAGLSGCHVEGCCRDYKLKLSDDVFVCVHSYNSYKYFFVELDLLYSDGSKIYSVDTVVIDVKWCRFDSKLGYKIL